MRPGRTYKDHRYAVNRSGQKIFQSYPELLAAFGEQGRHTQFCEVIDPPSERTGGSEDLSDYPWPTLIIGSGCTAIDSWRYLDLERLKSAVVERLVLAGRLAAQPAITTLADSAGAVDGEGPEGRTAATVRNFLDGLYADRIAPSSTVGSTDVSSASGPEVTESTARLVLVAARLTRFYHLAQAERVAASSRWGDDVAVSDGSQDMNSVDAEVAKDITDLINALREQEELDGAVTGLILGLLKDIREGFDLPRKQLRRDDLRLVTEVAWHFITQRTAIYPGWTELLLSMLIQLGRGQGRLNRRPAIENLATAPTTVAALLREPTKRSWAERWTSKNGAEDARERFYDEAALLLKAEAEVLQSRLSVDLSNGRFPPAAAFVSGFDLELEMSLWKRGISFTVMVPVHVQEDDNDGALAWLAYDVEPKFADLEEQLELLMNGGEWRVASKTMDRRDLIRPIVVRMSGSPLLRLPEGPSDPKMAELKRSLGYGSSVKLTINHAVVLDEYTALQVSLSDLAGSIPQADSKVVLRSLPLELTNHPDYNPRYWLSFGVQISDSAIRFRLFAQLSRRDLSDRTFVDDTDDDSANGVRGGMFDAEPLPGADVSSPGAEAVEPKGDVRNRRPRGLAVNTRIDHDEAMLLYWLGFNILQTDSKDMIDALHHCRDHIMNPSARPSRSSGCPLEASR